MRKFILITAMGLVSATAHAGGQRSLTLASSDETGKSIGTMPAETAPAEATPETPKFVERPAVVDPKAGQPAVHCQPAPTTAEAPRVTAGEVATGEEPKHRHRSTEARVISELHRHGIYW